ncbi:MULTISPECIES: PadR family transcriptional regulator [unclassified Novosphingobium]|uniref:PadR family transcriptional regulator n=1 Tax=unclassified Novosphingobium TaxID=2644732 RepID=UPI000ED22C80|nr:MULTISPECIES: PadR family transcriptional regulator [unclassified Novosphingobium]HCF25205.1 hypothetical protein [Novosphingobium sp.]HQV02382.1 PadR family transcriptional regulator [Novosphingobium sp.]
MSKSPFPTGIESIVLKLLLAKSEMYGLEMIKESAGRLKRGTIYVTLNRMEEKGLIKSRSEKDPRDPGMPRRLYQITGAGQRALNAWEFAASGGQMNWGAASYA